MLLPLGYQSCGQRFAVGKVVLQSLYAHIPASLRVLMVTSQLPYLFFIILALFCILIFLILFAVLSPFQAIARLTRL